MGILMDFLLIVIIICFILIWYIVTFNNFQNYIIRINEAETEIDATLRKRFDLLSKAIGIIKTVIKKDDILTMISEVRSKKLNNFELDRKLYDAINEFQTYREENEELRINESFIKIESSLAETEAEIEASRKYYNDIITDYNRMVKRFPSMLVGFMMKYKTKKYYDGKDLNNSKRYMPL